MIKIPAVKEHLQPIVLPGEGVLLHFEDGAHALYGVLYEKLIPLIDGLRSGDEIADALAGEFELTRIYFALGELERCGHIAESVRVTGHLDQSRIACWQSLGLDAADAERSLGMARARVLSIGGVQTQPLIDALDELKIAQTSIASESAIDIAVTDDYLNEALVEVSTAARATNRRWMPLRAEGLEVWIGPVFAPDESGCLECLRHKLSRHRLLQRFAATHTGTRERTTPHLSSSHRAACNLAVTEVAKVLAGVPSALQGKVLSIDTRTWESRTHGLIINPRCSVCGTDSAREATAVKLASQTITFAQDGGHRTSTPEATLKRYEHLVSPITGVVHSLRCVSSPDGVAHVYTAGHNAVVGIDRLHDLKRGVRNSSVGKGATDVQSRTSALCEAIERYSGEVHGGEIRIPGSMREMRTLWGDDVIHPNTVMGFSDAQYARRAEWTDQKSRFHRIPEPFDDETSVDWTPVWSLTHQRHKYLPTQLVYFKAKAGANCDKFLCFGCSNGNASGNTLEEAVLQGFFELVERDAAAIWWYSRLSRPGVDISSFAQPWFQELRAEYDSQGRDIWALDITSDLEIPTFVALSALRGGNQERILLGLGCHLDARIALQRSLAELNQILCMAHVLDKSKGDHGGSVHPYQPTPQQIELAERTIAACQQPPAYGRVDLVRDNHGHNTVMELELIEPELWLRYHLPAATSFATAIAARM